MAAKGAVAAGHAKTAGAACTVLEEGGNAFDAALAGLCAACVAEPVLISLGGGGFMLARPADRRPVLYDFFAQTPAARRRREETDFFPVFADFGTARQKFHIGMGSIATPGMVKGLFRIQRELGRMPIGRIVEPAIALARQGVRVNRLQAFIFSVVREIYLASEESRRLYERRRKPATMLGEGELFVAPELADLLDGLSREGEDLFYRGEPARRLVADCRERGGHLSAEDLERYEVLVRAPLEAAYRNARIYGNPPPSTGGILVAFALAILGEAGLAKLAFGSAEHLARLARVMDLTDKARIDSRLHEADEAASPLLEPRFVAAYRARVLGRPGTSRGTTHISVIDSQGNAASASLSNGEGAGYMIPGTGTMLNNMLGEDDINPRGFHRWTENSRICSMMAPTLALRSDTAEEVVLGSGGSSRIRTAILQVLLNLLDFEMTVEGAVNRPRIHLDGGLLNVEAGFETAEVAQLERWFANTRVWPARNLFFGGVHCVSFRLPSRRFAGAGDERRGGVFAVAG
jgi:gamma-glutamyltranspeptidase/glutathione hydrolase